ncbi:hypothetical protein pipiens_020120, partial [Culex pipiens pipiens]
DERSIADVVDVDLLSFQNLCDLAQWHVKSTSGLTNW